MFRPYFGTCLGTLKQKGCGEEGIITTNSRKLCQKCEAARRKPKGITKVTPKQRERIKENKAFYERFIENHQTKKCDECQAGIQKPMGSNVSHIIANGSNPALYHDLKNGFLLCQACENTWTNGDRTTMNIWPEAQRRRTELLREHYEQPLIKKK